MEITFPELTERIEEGAQKVRDASGLEEKALAAEELLGQTGELGTHIGGYARVAWYLDMLCFLAAILAFYAPILEGLLPVLLLLPVVFDLLLAAVCKRTLVTVEQTAVRPRSGASNTIQRIKNALYDAQGELNPTNFLPAWTVYLVGVLFMVTAGILLFSAVAERSAIKISTILAAVLLFLLSFGLFVAILWVKLFVLSLCFSSRSCKRELEELLEELPDYEAAFRQAEEAREAEEAQQRRLADLKEGEELYKMATEGTEVNKILLSKAAEKGDPRANLELGKGIIENVEGLSDRQIVALYRNAKKHFQIADEAGLPDGILMYASARLMTESHDESGWTDIFRRLRSVERVQVSYSLRNIYTMVRERLLDKISSAATFSEE